MRRLLAAVGCALLVGVAGAPQSAAVAQEPTGQLRVEAADVGSYPDVRLSVRVPADPYGTVAADAFTVRENGEVRAAQVEQAATADLEVVLLIDVTGSMGGAPLEGAKDAATAFLDKLPEDANVAVLSYHTETTVLTDFSASRDEHAAAIDGLVAGGRTATYEAVAAALEVFPSPLEERDGEASRAILLLTDGEDNASTMPLGEVVEQLAASDVTLHAIEYLTAFTDMSAIEEMAAVTGGAVREADDAETLARVYEELAADLVNRYTLVYRSEGHGPVEVTVDLAHPEAPASASHVVELPPPPPEEPKDRTVVSPPPPVEPPPAQEPSPARGDTWLVAGAVSWFVALATLGWLLLAPGDRRAQPWWSGPRMPRRQRRMSEVAHRASMLAERGLERRGYATGINAALERAGINLRPGEFIVLVACAAVTGYALGIVLQGVLLGLALAAVAAILARLGVTYLAERRQGRFADQLADLLQLLSGSLRAGYSLMQAVDAAAREADKPASEEFNRLVVEIRLGRDMVEALRAMAERLESEDLSWVVQAIEIHREIGGDLAEVLDNVARTIRERNQIRRQVKALSAEGRLSAWVLVALPFGVGFVIYLGNPSYIGELVRGGLLGWTLVGVGTLLMTVGVLWLRRIVKLVF